MSISFPGTANDTSVASASTSLVAAPPVNVANGDVLIATVICRNAGGITPPGTWTTLLSSFTGTNGDGLVQYLAVPSAGGLPGSWTWTTNTGRASVIVIRVVGMNVSSPVFQVGTPVAAGSDGPGAIPMILPGITAGGGVMAGCFTFFSDQGIPSDFVPGFAQLAAVTTPTAGVGRSSLGVAAEVITGATGDITTANDITGGATGQDGVLIGFQAASGPAPSGPAYTASMSSM